MLLPIFGGLLMRPPKTNCGGRSNCTASGKMVGNPVNPRPARLKFGVPCRMSMALCYTPTVISRTVVGLSEPVAVADQL